MLSNASGLNKFKTMRTYCKFHHVGCLPVWRFSRSGREAAREFGSRDHRDGFGFGATGSFLSMSTSRAREPIARE